MSSGDAAASRPTLGEWLALIRFSHTIFALPFALIALLVATAGRPPLGTLLWIVVAMVAARTAAMAYNRYADRHLDARNPRTMGREIPRGRIAPQAALLLALGSAVVFVAAAAMLAPICGWLALPVIGVLFGYSHAKRFTALCHLWLGVALGLAPPAAWLAARGAVDASIVAPLLLGLGVSVWVAGFDVLYACQDVEFDRGEGLFSLPVRFGPARALTAARAMHLLATVCFVAFGLVAGLGWIWFAGVGLCSALLAIQHKVVRADDLSRINLAFFTLNGAVGIAMLAAVTLDLWLT